ncbi:Obg-like ATPase [Dissostichus eleginoides]|nr:Obg-like ATPase [Dissostichus eleginoides]
MSDLVRQIHLVSIYQDHQQPQKSTFFNVLTKSQAAAEHFPFCTIDPNESRVPIPDERYDFLCQFHKPPSKVPAFLNVVDIAGLVKGAHAGQGLGNAFLSHISACDGIFHLTRAFEDEDIIHVEGTVDPVRDMEIIHEELRLKDEEMIGPIIDKLEKMAIRGGDKKLKPEYGIWPFTRSGMPNFRPRHTEALTTHYTNERGFFTCCRGPVSGWFPSD